MGERSGDGGLSLVKKQWSGTGTFLQADGAEAQVFLRTRLHRRAQEKERLALQQVQQVQTIPAPKFLGIIQKAGKTETTLVQSYIDGVDLAQLLSPFGRPPSPVAYCHLPVDESQLLASMQALGKVIAHLHAIKMDQFGEILPGSKPLRDGRAFTLQTVHMLLKRGVDRGWLSHALACRVGRWIEQQVASFPAEEPASFVHSDLHPGNIRLVQEAGGGWQLQGVIDFEHAKYWYPEYDLVVLQWHLSQFMVLWNAFLGEYGQLNPTRMQFFEMIKLLMIISGHPPVDLYSQWARTKLRALQSQICLY